MAAFANRAVFWVALFWLSPAALAQSAPTPPFRQCPVIGAAASCGVLIVVNANNTISIYADPKVPPYENSDDTLTGFLNNSSRTISSLPLKSGTDILGFDGDGICSDSIKPKPAGCPFGPSGYEGPGTSFSNISSDHRSGTVNFSPGIPPGGSAYFGLEEALSAADVTVPLNTTCPADTASVGTIYSSQLSGTGGNGNYTWSLAVQSSLTGFTLNVTPSGMVTGNPTAAGTANFAIKISDSAGATAQQACSIAVTATDKGVQAPPVYPSGFVPATPSDTVYVTNAPQKGCLFGNSGPVVLKIPITRYVGQTSPDGTLVQAELMKATHAISGFARLTLPVFDIDSDTRIVLQGPQPEVDVVTINGRLIEPTSLLAGVDGQWRLNEFLIPIEYLRFPSQSPQVGQPPDISTAVNNIQIDIDVLNPNHDLWCAGFEWAQLSFSAIAPVILVHGTNADHTSWDETPGFKDYLTSGGIPYHYQTIDLGKNSDSSTNANNLCIKLNQMAVWYGASSFHLIAHSKGATDSRRFFNQNYRNPGCTVGVVFAPIRFTILSLTSLDTPSRGTMLSDVTVATLQTSFGTGSNDPDVNSLLTSSWLASYAGAPQPPALTQQTISGMKAFNEANKLKPPGVRYFSVAADADLDGDGHVDCAEAKPLLGIPECISADTMYQVLGFVSSVTVQQRSFVVNTEYGPQMYTYDFVAATRGPFEPNDLTSTVKSAHYDDFEEILTTKSNHSSVKNRDTAVVVMGQIQKAYPVGMIPP